MERRGEGRHRWARRCPCIWWAWSRRPWSGYLCIRLLKFIADKGRFGAFAYYCWAVGVLTLVLQGIK